MAAFGISLALTLTLKITALRVVYLDDVQIYITALTKAMEHKGKF